MSIKNALSRLIHPFTTIEEVHKLSEFRINYMLEEHTTELKRTIRIAELQHSVMHCTEQGVTKEQLCDHEVVVSLTTYKERIHEVYLTIESIMQGTIRPNRIILWLAEEEFRNKTLPLMLQQQQQRGLEIRYCKDWKSYKKLIPTLKLCPEACIVTIDDDTLYVPDLLEHLIISYKEHPNCVSACRIHKITTTPDGFPKKYSEWDKHSYEEQPSHYNFLTGCGGTIFPPNSLPQETMNEEIFMKICPTCDDVWINAMLLLNKIKVNKAFTHDKNSEDFIYNESPHVTKLYTKNKIGGNDVQLSQVWTHYKLLLHPQK